MNLKCFILLFSVLLISSVSALGITPAIKNINFEPLGEVNITFYVLDASEDQIYDVLIGGGELLNYSSVNTDSVKGNGAFMLTVRFPEKDWKFIQKLIKEGEFTSPSDAIRAAVRDFRKKHGD